MIQRLNHATRTIGLMRYGFKSSHLRSEVTSRSFTASSPTMTPLQKKGDFEYCVDLVQNRDREAYLCGLLMPSAARRSYFAIRAFNVELASIKDSSMPRRGNAGESDDNDGAPSSSLALRIRIQWWRDTLGFIYSRMDGSPDTSLDPNIVNSAPRNPVVRVLHDAVQESNLTRRFLERLLEAREGDLDVKQLARMDDLKVYSEATASSLMYLSLETTGAQSEESDMCAQQAGIGIGMTMAIRAAQFRFVQGECSIPSELLPSNFPYYKANTEKPLETMSAEEKEQLEYAALTLAQEAGRYLSQARDLQTHVPKGSKQCLLPVVPSMQYLSKLEKAKYNIFDPVLTQPAHLSLLAMLSRTWLTGIL